MLMPVIRMICGWMLLVFTGSWVLCVPHSYSNTKHEFFISLIFTRDEFTSANIPMSCLPMRLTSLHNGVNFFCSNSLWFYCCTDAKKIWHVLMWWVGAMLLPVPCCWCIGVVSSLHKPVKITFSFRYDLLSWPLHSSMVLWGVKSSFHSCRLND